MEDSDVCLDSLCKDDYSHDYGHDDYILLGQKELNQLEFESASFYTGNGLGNTLIKGVLELLSQTGGCVSARSRYREIVMKTRRELGRNVVPAQRGSLGIHSCISIKGLLELWAAGSPSHATARTDSSARWIHQAPLLVSYKSGPPPSPERSRSLTHYYYHFNVVAEP